MTKTTKSKVVKTTIIIDILKKVNSFITIINNYLRKKINPYKTIIINNN